ncbi:hypothetical protein GCM10027168_61850 [Streptomyces capparidis]
MSAAFNGPGPQPRHGVHRDPPHPAAHGRRAPGRGAGERAPGPHPSPHWALSPLADPACRTDPRAVREALETTANAMANGAKWLAAAAADPDRVLAAWGAGELAHVPTGPGWQIVRCVKPLGLDAVVRMCAANHRLGPVLLTVRGTVEFLVSAESSRGWRLPGTTVVGAPGTLHCPHPHVVPLRAVRGRTWLVPPDGTGTLTDGDLLCEALAAARAAASVLGGTW